MVASGQQALQTSYSVPRIRLPLPGTPCTEPDVRHYPIRLLPLLGVLDRAEPETHSRSRVPRWCTRRAARRRWWPTGAVLVAHCLTHRHEQRLTTVCCWG